NNRSAVSGLVGALDRRLPPNINDTVGIHQQHRSGAELVGRTLFEVGLEPQEVVDEVGTGIRPRCGRRKQLRRVVGDLVDERLPGWPGIGKRPRADRVGQGLSNQTGDSSLKLEGVILRDLADFEIIGKSPRLAATSDERFVEDRLFAPIAGVENVLLPRRHFDNARPPADTAVAEDAVWGIELIVLNLVERYVSRLEPLE